MQGRQPAPPLPPLMLSADGPTPLGWWRSVRIVLAMLRGQMDYGGGGFQANEWDDDKNELKLWWGPTHPVEKGMLVVHFKTPYGYQIETVTRPQPKVHTTTGTSTARFG